MLRNYLKVAWRNIVKNRVHSFINIAGLSAGMAVAMLIGLWISDELSFNKYHNNYDRIARVMQNQTYSGVTGTHGYHPLPLANELRMVYGNDFRHVIMTSGSQSMMLSCDGKKMMRTGAYFETGAPEMLTLKMLRGNWNGLDDPASILLSESLARAFFGDTDPMDKLMKIDDQLDVRVKGIYKDLPQSSEFADISFFAPWEGMLSISPWLRERKDDWSQNNYPVYVQLAESADMSKVSAKILDIKLNKLEQAGKTNSQLFLHPMNKWHLYSQFENGINTGGHIRFVWLFGIIGGFVLLLACINFMNLATARSEKRAREVGIRKSIGSLRSQLIKQFFSESLLVVAFAFVVSLGIVQLLLPFFNEVAGKQMSILWGNPVFWVLGIGFSLITGLIAGSYPALYLSSFKPIKVLKGTFRAGRFAAIPRKVLVVLQFTVSIVLIIGVLVVFNQILFAKSRPVGYTREGLVTMKTPTDDIVNHFDAIRVQLKNSGAITEMATSHSSSTKINLGLAGFNWRDKDPATESILATILVSYEFGQTVGWQFTDGRDFSREYLTDSSGLILNETAVRFMGFKKPLDETITLTVRDKTFTFKVIGVIKDMVMGSPYAQVSPSVFMLNKDRANFVTFRLNSAITSREALGRIETVIKQYNAGAPFEYRFVDEEYAAKFYNEERIARLSGFFAILAIFISCLGLFGMASFVAEQRTKEIGVRKVLGATVVNLWGLLSREFVALVSISLLIAIPVAFYFMHAWLLNYEYRSELSWWIFGATGLGAMIITLITVSFQTIKAAIANPVKSLRTE